ncbi:MAG: hypothetical protein KDE47_21915, partial [Caldilineaceae bacterium]|nr:hypothetical protein [Caldilineaceae bacterium]
MTITLASSLAFWRTFMSVGGRWRSWWLAYIVLATAALYTLYYCAFLLLAHLLWAIWHARRQWRALRVVLLTYLTIALLYTPWVVYTATNLLTYVDDKVGADQDQPLSLLAYLWRHGIAFFAGHLPWIGWASAWRWVAVAVVLLLGGWHLWYHNWRRYWRHPHAIARPTAEASRALWLFLLLPSAIAFAVNRIIPFFPEGGERLLLFLLPYALLLVAVGIDQTWQRGIMGKGVLSVLLLTAGVGIYTFYTLPRHRADDYRPLIQQVVQQGRDDDTLLATFPWQVGLWRAYAPQAGLPLSSGYGPQIWLLSERSVTWGEPLRIAITQILAKGTLWFPGLRSIGSTLPTEIERFLAEQPTAQRPVPLVDTWYGNTTLRAWRQLPPPKLTTHAVDFGAVHLLAAGVTPTSAASANTPLRIDLQWMAPADSPHGMTIRLLRDGHQWANHDRDQLDDVTGFIVPAGLPPGLYEVYLGVIDAGGALLPVVDIPEPVSLVPLAALTVTVPTESVPAARLPIQHRLTTPVVIDGLKLLGYSAPENVPLAGESMAVTLFWQNGA